MSSPGGGDGVQSNRDRANDSNFLSAISWLWAADCGLDCLRCGVLARARVHEAEGNRPRCAEQLRPREGLRGSLGRNTVSPGLGISGISESALRLRLTRTHCFSLLSLADSRFRPALRSGTMYSSICAVISILVEGKWTKLRRTKSPLLLASVRRSRSRQQMEIRDQI
ncbi:uncharacterized protein VTP21DRAFT_4309 [Calcarisporiella thermophila]|uniref:uncharacterized protein n=1 Tax=Calcarisporiella thermophila TaxID=911321 RepID=UPI0037421EF7